MLCTVSITLRKPDGGPLEGAVIGASVRSAVTEATTDATGVATWTIASDERVRFLSSNAKDLNGLTIKVPQNSTLDVGTFKADPISEVESITTLAAKLDRDVSALSSVTSDTQLYGLNPATSKIQALVAGDAGTADSVVQVWDDRDPENPVMVLEGTVGAEADIDPSDNPTDFAANVFVFLNANKALFGSPTFDVLASNQGFSITWPAGDQSRWRFETDDPNLKFDDRKTNGDPCDILVTGTGAGRYTYRGNDGAASWYGLEGQSVGGPAYPYSISYNSEVNGAWTIYDNTSNPLITSAADSAPYPQQATWTGSTVTGIPSGTAAQVGTVAVGQVRNGTGVYTVGTGGDFATIMEAMEAIDDASNDNIITLRLLQSYKRAPNRYDTFQWKPYIQIDPDGGSVRHAGQIGVGPDDGGDYNYDKAFQGIDFSLCAAADPAWMPFQQMLSGLIFNSVDPNYYTWADVAAMLASGVPNGTIGLVLNDPPNDVPSAMYILNGDSTVEADWIDITTNANGLNLAGLQAPGFVGIGANLGSVNLYNANLYNAYLYNANLYTSYLRNANLGGANLSSAYLRNAYLAGANLGGANLSSAYCVGTDFTGATMPANAATKEDFKTVVGDGNWDASTTTWTDGNPIGA